MKLRFAKMHGQGNDFVVIDGVRQEVRLAREQVRRLADRHRGVGFDLHLVKPVDPKRLVEAINAIAAKPRA